MGDRISISFRKTDKLPNDKVWVKESVAFFSHWNGRGLLEDVKRYASLLQSWIDEDKDGIGTPLKRKEPDTVIVDFIRWMTSDENRVESNFYLGKDGSDGDNSDNGHWVFDLDKMDFEYR